MMGQNGGSNVAIPFKWGQVSYIKVDEKLKEILKVAIPFKWGQVSYVDSKELKLYYRDVAIPFKWGQVSYGAGIK